MHRPRRAATILAAILLAVALVPATGTPPAAAGGACGTHRSETDPPATIRVARTATGAVDVVDFRTYVKNVLLREWISSWTTESLRSGALAVKHYGWYQVLHWRGYVTTGGECFDVFDSTRDQYYDPSRPTYPAMAAAVDATWGTVAHRSGRIFATYYNAGAAGEACGANVNGWQMFQWGTQACGIAGLSAAQIIATYYPGAVVSSAPAPAPPTNAPTPAPTPTPAPVTPTTPPLVAPAPSGVATPVPTPVPVPLPTVAPTPTQPLPAAQPGGGQVGLVAPPPPPPPDPAPIVVSLTDSGLGAIIEVAAAGAPDAAPARPSLDPRGSHAVVRFEQAVDAAARRPAMTRPAQLPAASRLLIVRLIIEGGIAIGR